VLEDAYWTLLLGIGDWVVTGTLAAELLGSTAISAPAT
jgi:hypothetical protein